MDSCDEKLTLENVDEQIEQCLAQSQGLPSATMTSQARTIHHLQSIYKEERRLEDVWARINSRVSAGQGQQADTVNVTEQDDAPIGQADAPTVQDDALTEQGQTNTVNATEQDAGIAGREQAHTPTVEGQNLGLTVIQGRRNARQDAGRGRFNSASGRANKQSRLPFHRSWYTVGLGLVAAMILIVFLVWPMVSYALRGSWFASPQPAINKSTPQIQPTAHGSKQQNEPKATSTSKPTTQSTVTPTPAVAASPTAIPSPTTGVLPNIKVYSGQYFTIQYPTDWVITSVTTGSVYVQTVQTVQTVQFRPSASSSVFVNVSTMSQTSLTSNLLLLADVDVKQGVLQSTTSVTYHGITWAVGTVEISTQTPAIKREIAYSNQGTPYRIEFSAASDTFSTYAPIFNAMFASFYPAS